MKTEPKTYTLEELTGPPQRWHHWFRKSLGRALCGYVWPPGSAFEGRLPNSRMCPDCERIKNNEGR